MPTPPSPRTPRTPRTRRSPLRGILTLLTLLLLAAGALAACGDDGSAAADDGTTDDGGGGATEPDEAPEPFTLRVGYIGTREWGGPEGYAFAEGLLLEALEPLGVTDIESFAFPNGPDLNNALTGGSLDIGLYGDTPAINFRSTGQQTRLINQTRVNLAASIYTPRDGAASLADLTGGTIAVAQGSFMHRFVLGLLEDEGLDDEIEVTNLPLADSVAALESGSIDAVVVPWSFRPILDAQEFPEIVSTFPDHPQLAGSSVTVGTESFLADHPDFVEAWNQARADAIELITDDPEPYYEFQQPILDVDLALVPELEEELANYPVEPFTDEGLALLEGTKAFLVGIGAAQSDFEITEWQILPGGS